MTKHDSINEPVFRLDHRHRFDCDAIESHAATLADDFDFDEIIQSMEEDLGRTKPESTLSFSPSAKPRNPLHLEAPAPLIRRSIQELESGALDELLIHQLLGLERGSAEFKEEYVRLRVESLMKARKTTHPSSGSTKSGGPIGAPGGANLFEASNPWQINRIGHLWAFFGPWLTAILGIQFYASHKLCGFLANRDIFPDVLPALLATLIMGVCASTFSAALLLQLRGRDFHDFTPRLLGIGATSALLAIAFYAVEKVT